MVSLISGLIHAVFLMFLLGLSLASALIKITWLDMRADLGALMPAFIVIAVILFALNRFYEMDSYLFWEKKGFPLFFIPVAILVILAANEFNGQRLSLLPASTVREGFNWKFLSIADMNWILAAMIVLGIGNLFIYKKRTLEGRRSMDKRQKQTIWMILVPSALLLILYLVQPGVRYFINDATSMLAAADIEAFRDYLLSFGIWAPIISALLMIFQSVAAPLPAFVITFANGMLFGALWGGLLSWSSAMLGAALCYFIARAFGRPAVEKLVSKTALEWTDLFFDKYGNHAILLARLLPIVSFDLVSYGAGLTSMRFWGFWLATGIGQAPATILYSYLGQTASGSVKILFWVFVGVICLGILIAAWKKRSRFTRLKDEKRSAV